MAQGYKFRGIGATDALGVSGDGAVVVGHSNSRPIRWTLAAGVEMLSGATSGRATAISADGTTIVGYTLTPQQAFRWTAATGAVGLGFLPGYTTSEATAVSSDGRWVVGRSDGTSSFRAFRWTSGQPMEDLGIAAGAHGSAATAVSGDGMVVTGMLRTATNLPFLWTPATGMQVLQLSGLSTCDYSRSTAMSLDGTVITGVGSFAVSGSCQNPAFRYSNSRAEVLPWLPQSSPSNGRANGVSQNGAVIVGAGYIGVEPYWMEAIIWDEHHLVRSIKDTLVSQNIAEVTGWTLIEAKAVSSDGTTIVGSGRNPSGQSEGWVATFPRPLCYANFDASTRYPALNAADFMAFMNAFAAGDLRANCDGSTGAPILNVGDFNCFVSTFNAGCS